MSDIKKIKDEYLDKLDGDLNLENVNQIKTELFGKNGAISNSFKKLGTLPPEDRKKSGLVDSLLRLSVGIEDVDDLIEDLKQAIG